MSYLLMQILICLLIAGLIGMIIGWLLRGGCKGVLKDNDTQWENKLLDTNNSWEQKIQGLLSEHHETTQEADLKIINLREAINKSKDQIAILEQKLKKANSDITLKNDEIKKIQEKADSFEKELQLTKENLEKAKATHQSEIKEWQTKLDKTHQEHKQKAQSLLGDTQNKIKSLEQQLNDSKEKLNISQAKIETLVEELENTRKVYKIMQVELRSARNKLSQKEIEAQQPSTPEAQPLLNNNNFNENEKEEEEEKISKPTLLKEAKNGKKDNLTLVKGIGKVLEERLNNLGVFHFEQIASWTKTEQAWIDKYMSFPGRIEREEWVQQAKKLLKGIETEFAKRVKSGEVPTSKKE